MHSSNIVKLYNKLQKEINKLGLSLFLEDGKFIVSNARGADYEDDICFYCKTVKELDAFIKGIGAGELLRNFYDKRTDTWSGKVKKNRTYLC